MRPSSLNLKSCIKRATYKQLSPADRLTYLTYAIALIANIATFTLNSILNYQIPKQVSLFIIVLLLIGFHLYFNLKKRFASSLLVIISLNLCLLYLCYTVGLTTAYFMYSYVLLCAIPFMSKRDKHYLRNSLILSLIILLIVIITIIISPQYNHENLLIDNANEKLLTNFALSFVLFITFVLIIVIVFSNITLELLKAKKDAEKQKDTKTRVLSNLGHELRTQLSSIHGITQLILEQNEKKILSQQTFTQYTDTLEVCNKQMLFLVNDILDIQNIESGSFKLNSQPENLNQLLNQVFIPFKNDALTKNLVFEVSIDPILNNNYVNIDAFRLTQVLQNLISNALKYTQKGFIRFSTKVESQNEQHIIISFSVKDSGVGISKENLLKVFDSFQQIRDKNTINDGGTGLGLAISKTIVEEMGSHIHVSSIPNVGSEFNFTLKLTKVPYLSKPTEVLNDPKLLSIKLGDKKILITEDNKISMLYVSKLLEKNGAKVLKAYNGVEAIKIAETNPDISLILLDLEMPQMNGFTTIEHIRKIDSTLKVIAFTANIPDDNLHAKLKQLNFDGFLAKPFKNEEMFSILNKHLN